MNVMEIETASRLAWPALEEQELPFGVLRYARGTDRRANSLSLYPNARFENAELISVTENFFARRNIAPTVRLLQPCVSSFEDEVAIDTALAYRGYEKQSLTHSMLLDLDEVALGDDSESCHELTVKPWLCAWYELTNRQTENLAIHNITLAKIKSPHLFLANRNDEGCALSSGMGVLAFGALGLFGIATAKEYRNRGHASKILASLLNWGRSRGARYAYLQVEESNHAALSLYQRWGFRKLYSYWYRVGNV
jgi:GNAT superfamily N-acetyltransferase